VVRVVPELATAIAEAADYQIAGVTAVPAPCTYEITYALRKLIASTKLLGIALNIAQESFEWCPMLLQSDYLLAEAEMVRQREFLMLDLSGNIRIKPKFTQHLTDILRRLNLVSSTLAAADEHSGCHRHSS
jgi:hypothetical protein